MINVIVILVAIYCLGVLGALLGISFQIAETQKQISRLEAKYKHDFPN